MDSNLSYLMGLLQTDGSLSEYTRNRGKISLEISLRDEDIIHKLIKIIPCKTSISYRTRDTNFKKDYKSVCLTLHDWAFREELKALGLPVGQKHEHIAPPTCSYIELDYIRGLFDGDGSLGLIASGIPFISLTTKSDHIKTYILDLYKKKFNIIKKLQRNARDNIYDIVLKHEDAQVFAKELYYEKCLCIDRKYNRMLAMQSWVRSPGTVKRNKRAWDKEEDIYILTHSLAESISYLNRTEQSIKTRLWRIEFKEEYAHLS